MSFQPPSLTCRALITRGINDEEPGAAREYVSLCYSSSSLTRFPLAMERPPTQGSILTDTSSPDSLFKLSEASKAKGHTAEPPRARPDTVPDILFSPASDHVRELKHPPAPLLHLGDTPAQPTCKLPRIPFPDPPRLARRPLLGHDPSVTT